MGLLSKLFGLQNQGYQQTSQSVDSFDLLLSQYWVIDDYEMTSNEKEQAYRFLINSGGQKDDYICGYDLANEDIEVIVENGEEPSWSPSGEQFAFICDPLTSHEKNQLDSNIEWTWYRQIYAANETGRNIWRITQLGEDIGHAKNPVWSPNEKQIVFQADSKLFILNLETGAVNFLIDGENPFWAPGGDYIAFTHVLDRAVKVYSLSEKKIIFETKEQGYYSAVSWSPSGRFFAYTVNIWFPGDRQGFLHVNDTETGKDNVIYSLQIEPVGSFNGGLGSLAWSPDDEQIVFGMFPDLYLINLDGSNLIQLTNGQTDHPGVFVVSGHPSWRSSND